MKNGIFEVGEKVDLNNERILELKNEEGGSRESAGG
jgi:hypothetical protein